MTEGRYGISAKVVGVSRAFVGSEYPLPMLATPLYIPAEKPEMLDSLDKKDEKVGKTSTVYGINIFVCAYCSKAFYPRQYTKKPAFQPESGRYFCNGVFFVAPIPRKMCSSTKVKMLTN